jgi:hypothetical protein
MVESAAIRTFLRDVVITLDTVSIRDRDDFADWRFSQVISRTPRCSPSTRFPRCTSSCSTASLALSTARLSGTFVHVARTTASAISATRAAEKILGRTSAISCPIPRSENTPADRDAAVSAPARAAATVLLPRVSVTTRMARRSPRPRALRPPKRFPTFLLWRSELAAFGFGRGFYGPK